MAFNNTNLTPAAALGNMAAMHVIWNYSTGDNLSTVETYGSYFASAVGKLRPGDFIDVTANDGKASYYVDGFDLVSPSIGLIKVATVSSFVL
jgi:hypothetical protein